MLKSYVKAAVLVMPTLLFGLDAESHYSLALHFSCSERACFPKLAFSSIRNSKARGESRTNTSPQLMLSQPQLMKTTQTGPLLSVLSLVILTFSSTRLGMSSLVAAE
ncbi:unnamed protein product [Citrullus colocynthis]|uniref:Secreted protein n=1 Tax=Citrullus colocynthis TaxID=252529 RepID=A0ABP0YGT0_9ROSI